MKKIFLAGFTALFLAFTSCQDAIDIEQPGELNPDLTFETVNDLRLGLNFVYASAGNITQIGLSSIWCDEVGIGFANGGQGLDGEYSFVMNSGSFQASAIWERNYDLINFANRLLDGAEGVVPAASEVAEYNDIVAQARALRAYGHFQLLTYFSPDLTDDNALGVIKMDFVPSVADELPRSTNGEVFTLINSDLDYAAANLLAQSNIKYISPRFVTALRARIALYREDYTNALLYAQELIDEVPLTPRSQYPLIWSDLADGEVIFKLERTTGNELVGALWHSVDTTISGSPFYEVGRSLFNILSPTDIRYNTIIHPTSVIDPAYQTSTDYRNSDILVLGKYPGSEGQNRLNDLKIFRVSEMYFIKAEAQINAGLLADAAQTLQEVRAARYTAAGLPALPVYGNAQQAWADVLKERRIELAFEGHRYVDLKRLGDKANAQIDRDPRDCELITVSTIPINDYRFTLPIPAGEIASNSAIASQQNPGYN